MNSEIDVLLLAAGLGTRLRPLTEDVPKALLPIYGTPLLDWHIARLLGGASASEIEPPRGGAEAAATSAPSPAGAVRARRVVVNAHHRADVVRSHLESHALRERLALSHEPEILGTGGAIAKAAPLLASDPFAVLNADALFAAPIMEAVAFHRAHAFAATLVVVRWGPEPRVRVAGERVVEIAPDAAPDGFTFTGFQIVSHAFVSLLPAGVFHDVRETYRRLIPEGRLGAYVHEPAAGAPFIDIGTPESYLEAHRLTAGAAGERLGIRMEHGARPAAGFGFIDASARAGAGALVRESVVLAGATIAGGVRVERSIVGPGATVQADTLDRLVTVHGARAIGTPAARAGEDR